MQIPLTQLSMTSNYKELEKFLPRQPQVPSCYQHISHHETVTHTEMNLFEYSIGLSLLNKPGQDWECVAQPREGLPGMYEELGSILTPRKPD